MSATTRKTYLDLVLDDSRVAEPEIAAKILLALRGLQQLPPSLKMEHACLVSTWPFMMEEEQMLLDEQILQLQHGMSPVISKPS